MTFGGIAKTPRLDSLTGLRIFAALAVFMHHAAGYQETPDWFQSMSAAGDDGVSFFFVLSGFVLAWSSRPSDTAGRFYRRRAARILPLYWIAWIVGAAYEVVLNHQALGRLIPSVFLVQSWFPQKEIHFAGNSVGWSLSTEMFFYLMFPVVILVVRNWNTRSLLFALLVTVAVIILIPLILQPEEPAGVEYWLIYLFPATRFFEFFAGILLALLIAKGVNLAIPLWAAALFAFAVSVGSNALPLWAYLVAASIVPFLILLGSAAQADLSGRRSVFSSKPIVKLGEWSFAFYLIHLVVLRLVISLNDRTLDLPWWVTSVLALIVGLALAAVLCEFVEKPVEKRLRGDRKLPLSLAV